MRSFIITVVLVLAGPIARADKVQRARAIFAQSCATCHVLGHAEGQLPHHAGIVDLTMVYRKLGERLPKNLLLKGEEDHGKEEAKHDHDHGEYDPHVWLGIPQAIAMVEMIRDELTKVDGAHAEDYEKNAEEYVKKLKKLQSDGQAKLTDKNDRKIIAFHESLGYFAKSFELNILDAIEVAPGQEPSPGHMKELVEKCKKENVRVIAVEPQYPKGTSAEVLQREVKGLEFAVVDPLETAADKDVKDDQKELKDKGWYEKKMKQNLDALAKSLP